MKIGLIARADKTGLGIQSKEFFNHVPCKALIIDSSNLAPSLADILRPNYNWYPGQEHSFKMQLGMTDWGIMPESLMDEFLTDLDILFAMETPYDYRLFDECNRRGIKTVLQFNYEFLDYPSNLPFPSLFAAPSLWNFEHVPPVKRLLPVPVNTSNFVPHLVKNQFLHIAGRPAIHDRNGTASLLRCLRYVKSEINLVIRAQRPLQIAQGMVPDNVTLNIDCSNKEDYFDNYYAGGVLIMPRRYGGLCLPVNEALAAEMPVIMPDISPNNTWLPKEWLVPAVSTGSFRCKRHVELHEVDQIALAQKIDEFCNPGFYGEAIGKAAKIKEQISWNALLPLYMETFNDLLK